jgi:hypothetical protein
VFQKGHSTEGIRPHLLILLNIRRDSHGKRLEI